MKSSYIIRLVLVCLLLSSSGKADELQRLAILPQTPKKITRTTAGSFETMCVDYFREAPSKEALENAATYNQVYSADDLLIKINGVPTTKSLESLISGDVPLLLLEPESHSKLDIRINPLHPDAISISSVELEFKKTSVVGNIASDRDISQATIIYDTWGAGISQVKYWNLSKCLDLLSVSGMATFENGKLSSETVKSCETLLKTIDFDLLDSKVFRTLVNEKLIVLDENLKFTEESNDLIRRTLEYENAISTTAKLNQTLIYSEEIDLLESSARLSNQKFWYYCQNEQLISLSKKNPIIRDTLIEGKRFVLMLCWKTDSFKESKFIVRPSGELAYYVSLPKLFDKPLFLTSKDEMEAWIRKTTFESVDETSYKKRIKQVLGLPPHSGNEWFMEFWVQERDLIRPCIDPSLTGSSVMYKVDSDYFNAFLNFMKISYKSKNLLGNYPFTGYGYTWDYNSKNLTHFGLNEFVLKGNCKVFLRREIKTSPYINQYKTN